MEIVLDAMACHRNTLVSGLMEIAVLKHDHVLADSYNTNMLYSMEQVSYEGACI